MAALEPSTEKLGVQALLEALEDLQNQATKDQGMLLKALKNHQDSLAEIQDSLVPIAEEFKREKDLSMLLADVRDAITDAARLMQEQSTDVLHHIDDLARTPAPVASVHGWRTWAGWSMAGVVLLSGALAWGVWPESRQSRLARALDGVLVQRYGALPATLQEPINSLYAGLGFASPAQRQKGR
jgi:hypothetical protein